VTILLDRHRSCVAAFQQRIVAELWLPVENLSPNSCDRGSVKIALHLFFAPGDVGARKGVT
jgi:hypothetical protein